ncbi:uncharacterized protein ASCRUDRAFT_142510 [Ascoidea rubescens DSM 1968]|uniref:Uncharacterized protein n=1 Tax=Ascoidea rubescens DSM 1968 TaxID=1344418 RepID=A0A1D2VIL5_9ASCO|nr:hypothetical protein ASCRUDRAFT_142510 [Ascoidea rubescens DSM 1968]ODV61471.1 hypothetical protein ASCRUDRAFT_142510 [Ascoidea rubescens DSM 1968]
MEYFFIITLFFQPNEHLIWIHSHINILIYLQLPLSFFAHLSFFSFFFSLSCFYSTSHLFHLPCSFSPQHQPVLNPPSRQLPTTISYTPLTITTKSPKISVFTRKNYIQAI